MFVPEPDEQDERRNEAFPSNEAESATSLETGGLWTGDSEDSIWNDSPAENTAAEQIPANPEQKAFEPPFVPLAYSPEPEDETIRKSGLAYSIGIVFFGSVVFMLFVGWFADLLLGSSPWGIVVGIIFGSIIGFVQFFRISSQIYKKPADTPAEHPILPDEDDSRL